MKSLMLKVVLLLCIARPAVAQYNSKNLKADYVKAASLSFRKLKIYPITATENFVSAHRNVGKYTTLEQAMKQKKIRVTEVDAGGEVNKLFVSNKSKDTVYLMAGEVVKGGKQDRVLGEDIVLLPGKKKNIESFCVEQGRWSGGGHISSGGGAAVAACFSTSVKASSLKIREAALIKKDQMEVWNQVADKTSKNLATTSTGTYTALENSKTFTNERNAYIRFFESRLANDKRVVGFAVGSGNKVIGCDLFATNHMFKNSLATCFTRM